MYPAYPYQQQPYLQQQAPKGISGRVVSSITEVNVNEVPSDGTAGWFPCADGSRVWSKRWRGDGTIETASYVLEPEPEPEPERDVPGEILARLDAIEAALRRKGGKNAE